MRHAIWKKEEDDYIRINSDMSDESIAKALDRTQRSIYERRRYLKVPPIDLEAVRVPKAMTKYEKEYRIRKMAAEMHVRIGG